MIPTKSPRYKSLSSIYNEAIMLFGINETSHGGS
jgi:hypothetical protein